MCHMEEKEGTPADSQQPPEAQPFSKPAADWPQTHEGTQLTSLQLNPAQTTDPENHELSKVSFF